MEKTKKIIEKLKMLPILLLLVFATQSCEEDEEEEEEFVQETSIIPSSYNGRPVTVAGTIDVSSKQVTFEVWDNATVDGDIISLIVNGRVVLGTYSLVANKRVVTVTLDNLGYNYILLYAHNEGSLPPNTAALSVTDSSGITQNLTLSANLTSNSAYNIIVN